MREFKFRGWNSKKQKMSEPFLFDDFDTNYFIPESWYFGDFEIMQYTGLLDKNGKEIWEGDILQLNNKTVTINSFTTHVIFNQSSARFELEDTVFMGLDQQFTNNLEVVGNIYEHPHLLNPNN